MNTVLKFASLSVAALLISTSMASALDPIGGLNETIAPTAGDSLQDAVQTSSTGDNINDAVKFDPKRDINDAVLAGAKTGKGKVVINGRTILLAFACQTGGTELLTVSNKGDAVPAGTKLRWEVKSLGERGTVLLKQDLAAGGQVRVDIGTDVDAGTPCAAKAI